MATDFQICLSMHQHAVYSSIAADIRLGWNRLRDGLTAQLMAVNPVCAAASSTYYGNAPPPHQENMLWVPSSPYAATKYAGELLVTSYNQVYSLPTLNLRFFMVGCAVRQH